MAHLNGRRRSRSVMTAVVALLAGLAVVVVFAVGPVGIASAASVSVNAELAKAKSELLVRSDFPQGWTGQGSATAESNNKLSASSLGFQQLGSCLGLSGPEASVLTESTPEADSPTFSLNSESVSESLDIYPSANQANESYQESTLSKVPQCFGSLMSQPAIRAQMESSFGKGSTLGTVVAVSPPKKDLIPHLSGVALELPFTQQGQTYDVYLGIVNWVKGVENPSLTFTSVNASFPGALAKHLETVAYDRS